MCRMIIVQHALHEKYGPLKQDGKSNLQLNFVLFFNSIYFMEEMTSVHMCQKNQTVEYSLLYKKY
jgi:hypothetical protein